MRLPGASAMDEGRMNGFRREVGGVLGRQDKGMNGAFSGRPVTTRQRITLYASSTTDCRARRGGEAQLITFLTSVQYAIGPPPLFRGLPLFRTRGKPGVTFA